jgi:hypothetical protein
VRKLTVQPWGLAKVVSVELADFEPCTALAQSASSTRAHASQSVRRARGDVPVTGMSTVLREVATSIATPLVTAMAAPAFYVTHIGSQRFGCKVPSS